MCPSETNLSLEGLSIVRPSKLQILAGEITRLRKIFCLFQKHTHRSPRVNYFHSRWGKSPFPMRMCIPGEAHPHSRWGWITMEWASSPGCISSPGMGMCLTGNGNVPHREWGCACLTRNGYPHRECTSSPRMHIAYTGCKFLFQCSQAES